MGRPYHIIVNGTIQTIQLGPLSLPGVTTEVDVASHEVALEAGGLLVLGNGEQAIFYNSGRQEKGRLQFKPDYPIDQIVYCPVIKMLVAIGGSFIQWYHPTRLTLAHFYQRHELGDGACILDNGDLFTTSGQWLSAANRYEPWEDLISTGHTTRLPYQRVHSLGTMVRVEQDGLSWVILPRENVSKSIVVAMLNGHEPPLHLLNRDSLMEIASLDMPVEMHIRLIEATEHLTDEMILLKSALRLKDVSHYLCHTDRLADLLQPISDFIQAWRDDKAKLTPHRTLYLECWQTIQQLCKLVDELGQPNGKPRILLNYWKTFHKKLSELLGKEDYERIISALQANDDPMQ